MAKKKVVIDQFVPIIVSVTPSGKAQKRALKAKDTYDTARAELDEVLINEPPNSVGEVKPLRVCVEIDEDSDQEVKRG